MKATVIIDNIQADGLRGEWGLSVMCEHNGKWILLDTGASDAFAGNAKRLGFQLEKVDYGVLSHAHYDHARGMKRFFEENSRAKFYLRNSTQENCYYKRLIFRKYIGIPRRILTEYRDRIVMVEGDYSLCDGVSLIPHKTGNLEQIGKREKMYQKAGGTWIPDDFSHEQSLVFETEKGLVIFNSCSHGGAANIIREVQETFPEQRVYGLVGGFHLYNKTEAEIVDLAEKIKETGIGYICTGHCTEDRAYRILKRELGECVHQMHTGMVMEF